MTETLMPSGLTAPQVQELSKILTQQGDKAVYDLVKDKYAIRITDDGIFQELRDIAGIFKCHKCWDWLPIGDEWIGTWPIDMDDIIIDICKDCAEERASCGALFILELKGKPSRRDRKGEV